MRPESWWPRSSVEAELACAAAERKTSGCVRPEIRVPGGVAAEVSARVSAKVWGGVGAGAGGVGAGSAGRVSAPRTGRRSVRTVKMLSEAAPSRAGRIDGRSPGTAGSSGAAGSFRAR